MERRRFVSMVALTGFTGIAGCSEGSSDGDTKAEQLVRARIQAINDKNLDDLQRVYHTDSYIYPGSNTINETEFSQLNVEFSVERIDEQSISEVVSEFSTIDNETELQNYVDSEVRPAIRYEDYAYDDYIYVYANVEYAVTPEGSQDTSPGGIFYLLVEDGDDLRIWWDLQVDPSPEDTQTPPRRREETIDGEAVTLSGTIESAAGASLDGSHLEFIEFTGEGAPEFRRSFLADTGEFEQAVTSGSNVHVTFFHSDKTAFDGVPILYGLAEGIEADTDTDIGPFEIPQAHQVEIRVVDTNGDPASGVSLSLRSLKTGSGAVVENATNEDGYVQVSGAGQTGVELVGEIGIDYRPQGGGGGDVERMDNITVPETTDITVELPDST